MISVLLNSIQTTLLGSRGFLITSFLPILVVSIASLWLDTILEPAHTAWLEKLSVDKPGTALSAAMLVIFVVSFVFSSINTKLRTLLEGEIFDIPIIARFKWESVKTQSGAASAAREELESYQRRYHFFAIHCEKWIDEMAQARQHGASQGGSAEKLSSMEKQIADAEGQFNAENSTSLDSALPVLVKEMTDLLKTLSANDKTNPQARSLSKLHVRLVNALQREVAVLQTSRLEAYWKAAVFPDTIAPTRMGNIAGTIRFYSESRYGLDLNIFWSRLQRIVDDKMAGLMQDAKIPVDFFVSVTWLATIFFLVWTPLLMWKCQSLAVFLVVSAGGPVLAALAYQLACQSYMAFADVVKTAVDLYRFPLIESYHLALPPGSREERQAWEDLTNLVGYNSKTERFLYRHKGQA